MLRIRTALFVAAVATSFAFAACGDGPDTPPATATAPATAKSANPTARPGASATATRSATPVLGTAPVLSGHIEQISPVHAAIVRQRVTRSPDPTRPNGVCVQVNFDGLQENAQWFRMAVNGVEVTTELTWVVDSTEAPTGGTACYAPEEGLPIGRIEAAVVVQNPRNAQEATRQTVAWRFDVIE